MIGLISSMACRSASLPTGIIMHSNGWRTMMLSFLRNESPIEVIFCAFCICASSSSSISVSSATG